MNTDWSYFTKCFPVYNELSLRFLYMCRCPQRFVKKLSLCSSPINCVDCVWNEYKSSEGGSQTQSVGSFC